jgi:hypothetical protein
VAEGSPTLRVVRGEPDAAELAALLAVLTTRQAPPAVPPAPRSAWADPARRLRGPMITGPGGWRRSTDPR